MKRSANWRRSPSAVPARKGLGGDSADASEAERFRELGLEAVVDRSVPPGLDLAAAVLRELGLEATSIESWMRQQQERVLASNVRPLAA